MDASGQRGAKQKKISRGEKDGVHMEESSPALRCGGGGVRNHQEQASLLSTELNSSPPLGERELVGVNRL